MCGPAERHATAANSSWLVERDLLRLTWEQISIIRLSTGVDRWPFLSVSNDLCLMQSIA